MQSLAWSTVVLLVLLLPGFFFFGGLYAPDRFARDLAPRNPLGTLAWTVLVAYLTHVLLSLVISLRGSPVQWATILLSMLPVSPTGTDQSGGAARVLGYSVYGSIEVPAYVILSCAVGWSAGWLAGKGAAAGMLPLLLQHSWVYDERGPGGKLIYAHVLSNIEYQGKALLYKGRLRYFGLNADGTLSYVVLLATEQRFLHLNESTPRTGPSRVIGRLSRADYANVEAEAVIPRKWPIRLIRRWIGHNQGPSSDGADRLLVISGAAIKDVIFHGYSLARLKVKPETTRQLASDAARAEDSVESVLRKVQAFERHLSERPDPEPWMITAEVQIWLRDLGYDPGPVDGIPGADTREAIRRFQQTEGLTPDGRAGQQTRQRLKERVAGLAGASKDVAGPATPSSQG
jgi:Putative peptidoglycan binding domain